MWMIKRWKSTKRRSPRLKQKKTRKPENKRMAFHTRDGMKNTVRTGIGVTRQKAISMLREGKKLTQQFWHHRKPQAAQRKQ